MFLFCFHHKEGLKINWISYPLCDRLSLTWARLQQKEQGDKHNTQTQGRILCTCDFGRCREKCVRRAHLSRFWPSLSPTSINLRASDVFYSACGRHRKLPLTWLSLMLFQDSEKRTPLHVAAFLGDAEIIELLILSGKYQLFLKVRCRCKVQWLEIQSLDQLLQRTQTHFFIVLMEVDLTSDFISRQKKQCKRLFSMKNDVFSKTFMLPWKSHFWLIRPCIVDEFRRCEYLCIFFIIKKNKQNSFLKAYTNKRQMYVCIYIHLNWQIVAKQYYVLSMDTWLWLCNKTWKERKHINFQIVVTSEGWLSERYFQGRVKETTTL